jgi:hypothetical protein
MLQETVHIQLDQPQVATQIRVVGEGGGARSDVRSREGFIENLIIMQKLKFAPKFKQHDRENVTVEPVTFHKFLFRSKGFV